MQLLILHFHFNYFFSPTYSRILGPFSLILPEVKSLSLAIYVCVLWIKFPIGFTFQLRFSKFYFLYWSKDSFYAIKRTFFLETQIAFPGELFLLPCSTALGGITCGVITECTFSSFSIVWRYNLLCLFWCAPLCWSTLLFLFQIKFSTAGFQISSSTFY